MYNNETLPAPPPPANDGLAMDSEPLVSFHFCAGALVPGILTFLLLLVGLLALYTSKYIFPVNYLMLGVFTLIQAIFFVGFKTIFNTNAAVFISGSMFLQVFSMFFLTSQTVKGEDELTGDEVPIPISFYISAAWAALINFVVVTILALSQVLELSFLEWLFSAFFATVITAWFSYDATCMTHKMSPDEYMQACVFFYTDVILFIVFAMIMCSCLMLGESGMEGCACCEGGEFGAVGGDADFGATGAFEAGGAVEMGAAAGSGAADAPNGLLMAEYGAMGGAGPTGTGDRNRNGGLG